MRRMIIVMIITCMIFWPLVSGAQEVQVQSEDTGEVFLPQTHVMASSNFSVILDDLIGRNTKDESKTLASGSSMLVSSSAGSVNNGAYPLSFSNNFQPDLFSGSGNVQYPIDLPVGRNGMTPSVALAYSSQGSTDILGHGWSLILGSIERSTKYGTPNYDGTDSFIVNLGGASMELIRDPGVSGRYQAKIENGFMDFRFDGQTWTGRDKSGTTYYFGLDDLLDDDSVISEGNKTFAWKLSEVKDVIGNYYFIRHFADGGFEILYTGEPGTDRNELSSNTHNFAVRVATVMETEDRQDKIVSYRTGFRVEKINRIKEIQIYAGNELQRKYVFGYSYGSKTGRSLLTQITQYGNDGVSHLPGMSLTYNESPTIYDLLSIANDPTIGNNLWNSRYDGGYDRGHEMYGYCPPNTMCKGVKWGSTRTVNRGSLPGGSYSIDGYGRLSLTAKKDAALYFWTYLYVQNPQSVTINATCSPRCGAPGIWLNGNYSKPYTSQTNQGAFTSSLPLKEGYNLVELTTYHQHASLGISMKSNVAGQVPLMHSSQVVVPQLAGDFNGDGLSDVATYFSDTGHIKVALSQGNAFSPKETWHSGLGKNRQIRLGDFNADGLTDLVIFNNSDGSWRVYTSNGKTAFVDQGVWLTNFGKNEQVTTFDFNGDGRTDVGTFYNSSGLKTRIALNKGSGFIAHTSGIAISGNGDAIGFAADFNSDGLLDFGAFKKSSGAWNVRVNQGGNSYKEIFNVTGFGTKKNMMLADFDGNGLFDVGYYDYSSGIISYRKLEGENFSETISQLSNVAFNLRSQAIQIQTADLNGDGLTDYMAYNDVGNIEVAYSYGTPLDLLESLDNGYGGRLEIEYLPSTVYLNTFLPFVMPLISKTVVKSAQGDSYVTNYQYGKGFWDALSREFRGFGTVRVIDIDGNYSESDYIQDDEWLKGRVSEQRVFDSQGRIFSKSQMNWQATPLMGDSKFVYLKDRINFVYDGDPDLSGARATAEAYVYGESPQYGNLTQAVQHGEVDVNSTAGNIIDKVDSNDSRRVETTYTESNTSSWIIGLPSQTRVYDNYGNLVRKTDYAYDNHEYGNEMPEVGLLTSKKEWGGAELGAHHPQTHYSYNSYGNLQTTIDPLGRMSTIVYDMNYHQFPLTLTNAKGHTIANKYFGINLDIQLQGCTGLWGQLFETTDPNNNSGQRCYDMFGRTVKTISPLDSYAYPTSETEYTFGVDYFKVKSSQRVQSGKSQTIDAYQFSDGLGRVIQSKGQTRDPGTWAVSGIVSYNHRGQVYAQYNPFFSAEPVDYFYTEVNVPNEVATPSVIFTYDAMGRLVKTDFPDGAYSNVRFNKWTTETFDENGHKQTSKFDAYGRLVERIEHKGADGRALEYPAVAYTDYAITRYVYDSEGNLTETVDAQGNNTVIDYDQLGRKIRMVDPDMGSWTYGYDLNGNLIEQTDNKGQTINFSYDELNRVVRKFDNGELEVNYNYDTDFTPASENEKGRLTEVNYANGTSENTTFEYDILGRELKSIKTINGSAYSVQREYDAINSLLNITYPDQEKGYYKYNNAGQIQKIGNDESILGLQSKIELISSNSETHLVLVRGLEGLEIVNYYEEIVRQHGHKGQVSRIQHFVARIVSVFEHYVLGVGTAEAATDFTSAQGVKGVWIMGANNGSEPDLSGQGAPLIQSFGDKLEVSSDMPVGYSGTSRVWNAAQEEYLYRTDGRSTDISGINQSMSICFWAKPSNLSGKPSVVTKYDYVQTVKKFQFKKAGLDWNNFVEKMIINGWGQKESQTRIRLKANLEKVKKQMLKVFGGKFSKILPILQKPQIILKPQYLMYFANRGGGYRAEFYINSDGLSRRSSIAVSSDDTIISGQWVHLCGVYDGSLPSGNQKVYINGELSGTPVDYTGGIGNRSGLFRLGASANNKNYYNGLLTEVALFNRSLSAGEVLRIMREGIDGRQGNDYWDTQEPTVPEKVMASDISSRFIELTWTASTDNVGVIGYKIYRDGQYLISTSQTNYIDTSLSADTHYAYAISAYDAQGNESAQSALTRVVTDSESVDSSVIVVLEAETMTTKTTGGAVLDGWNIWSNGYIQDAVEILESGEYIVEVRAKGNLAGSQLPRMDLRVDNVRVVNDSVGETEWTDYSFSVFLGAGVHQIGVQFMNDYYDHSADRNLVVDKITIRTSGIEPRVPVVYVEDVEYTASGQIERIVLGNGVTTEYMYDIRMRVKRVYSYDAKGNSIQDFDYVYDPAGNIKEIIDNVNTATQTFAYDELNRLGRAENPDTYGVKNYQYDTIGNITLKDGKEYIYAESGAGAHAVTRTVGGSVTTTYTYDANGNMVTRQTGSEITFFEYDVENQLTEVKKGVSEATAKKVEEYFYDGDGGRTRKISYNNGVDESATNFMGSLFEETGGNRTGYIFLGGTRVASITNGEVMWYLHDHLGGTNVLTDADGSVKQVIEYEPYGKESRNEQFDLSPQLSARYAFTNHFKDERTGLIFMQARYYDHDLGRFISSDTIVQSPSNPQTLNRYYYANNNPINNIDPDGHGWLKKLVGKANNWIMRGVESLENKWNVGISIDAEFGQRYEFQDAQTFATSTARLGLTAVTQPWQIGVGFYRWAYHTPIEIFETVDMGDYSFIRKSSIEDDDNIFVNGILNSKATAFLNGRRAYKGTAFKVAYNPTDGVLADVTESFFQKLTFTSSFDRQLARMLAGHKNIILAGHSQGAIAVGNTLLNLGIRDQRDVISYAYFYNTQISEPRAYLSAAMAGVNAQHVTYGTRFFDPSNVAGPNITHPLKFLSGIPGLYLPFGVAHHGIEE